MVCTRKHDYAEESMHQEHRQAAQPSRMMSARGVAADHIGKRSHGTFHGFQQLPYELRLMVWEAAMTPRLVAVNPRSCPKNLDEARNRKNREIGLIRGIQPLLAVNQEARSAALRHYTWRFTMDVVYGRVWGSEPYHGHVRIFMSPDDTLGLFQCRDKPMGFLNHIQDIEIKIVSDDRSPWTVHQTTDAPHEQHWFKKVAILGRAIKSNPDIVTALNTTLWDLDSILHAPSAGVRIACSPHTNHKILVQSAGKVDTFIGALPTVGLPRRGRPLQPVNSLGRDGQSLDVLTFKHADGEKGAEEFRGLIWLISRSSLP